jgi:hypothetical protein
MVTINVTADTMEENMGMNRLSYSRSPESNKRIEKIYGRLAH